MANDKDLDIIDYRETVEGKRRFANPEVYLKTVEFQEEMGKLGIAWHNHYADECTVDFCCCCGDNLPNTNYHTFIPSINYQNDKRRKTKRD